MTALVHATVDVLENVRLARQTYRVRTHCPDLAAAIRPGQFLMIRLPKHSDPLLGRPFALYDTVLDPAGRPVAIDIVYLVVGKVTGLLADVRAGDQLEMWGPLGNGFPDYHGLEHIAAGGGRHRSDAVPGPRPRSARHTRLRRSSGPARD